MAKMEANWVEINVETLSEDTRKAYEAYKNLYREMKALRTDFENLMQDDAKLPEGKRLVFGYNFGKLSVAIVDDDRKPRKAAPAKLSLSEYMAQQAAMGR